jgi:U3 small nucleolar RNA-associated protein 3
MMLLFCSRDKKQEAIDNWADPYDLREDARRSAGRGIVSNRGLMPYRKKDVRNPRVHMRHKYEKAMTKRRALVREYKGKDDQYAGEKTGIKTNVSRSVKLK